MKLIENNIRKLKALCKKHKVSKLFVFGKEKVTDYFDNYFNLKYALEDLFKRKVDLLEEQTIRNPYLKKSVNETKILIYG